MTLQVRHVDRVDMKTHRCRPDIVVGYVSGAEFYQRQSGRAGGGLQRPGFPYPSRRHGQRAPTIFRQPAVSAMNCEGRRKRRRGRRVAVRTLNRAAGTDGGMWPHTRRRQRAWSRSRGTVKSISSVIGSSSAQLFGETPMRCTVTSSAIAAAAHHRSS
eukprot:scaffold288747_cov41-Tisochrysis_lutea.AAC.3